jgi:predicted DNA binding CopG/RHH family protein
MSDPKELKKFPHLMSDAEAEHFVDTADLSEYDLSDMKRMHFEFKNKDARVNMRLPASLLAEIKAAAAKAGMPYQRFIRQALEGALGR